MPLNREWQSRIKAIEREHRAVQLAVARLREEGQKDPTVHKSGSNGVTSSAPRGILKGPTSSACSRSSRQDCASIGRRSPSRTPGCRTYWTDSPPDARSGTISSKTPTPCGSTETVSCMNARMRRSNLCRLPWPEAICAGFSAFCHPSGSTNRATFAVCPRQANVKRILEAFTDEPFDLLVLGGGSCRVYFPRRRSCPMRSVRWPSTQGGFWSTGIRAR